MNIKCRAFYRRENKFENIILKIEQDTDISRKNRTEIIKFLKIIAADGLSISRLDKYTRIFKKILELAAFELDLRKATESELRDLMVIVNESSISDNYKTDIRITLKKYYRTMNKGIVPRKAQWIITTHHSKKILPEDLLTREEIDKLVSACTNERNRCFIMMLYEGGFRVGELGQLRIKDLSFSEYGVVVNIPEGKTGTRRVLLIESELYLRNWLNVHPKNNDIFAPLWVTIHGECIQLGYDGIRQILKSAAKRSGIRKEKTRPHNFRHSRATHLAQHLTEAQMCQYFGWRQGTDMTATYVHLSGKDLDKIIMAMHGIKDEEEIEKPKKCIKCGKVNGSSQKHCSVCRTPLTVEAALEIEKRQQAKIDIFGYLIEKNPKLREKIINELSKPENTDKLLNLLGLS